MSCCDDEIIVETTVDEIIITEGAAVGVTPADVDNAIAAAIDTITPIWEQTPVTEAVYDASRSTDDVEAGLFSTFSAAYAALAPLRDAGQRTRLVIVKAGSPVMDDNGTGYDLSEMMIWATRADTFLSVAVTATASEPMIQSHNVVWTTPPSSTRIAPIFGTRSTTTRILFSGQGGIYTLGREQGTEPFWVRQNAGTMILDSNARGSFFGFGTDRIFELGASGQITGILRDQETWDLRSVIGTGTTYQILRGADSTLTGTVNAGVAALDESRFGDLTTDGVPEGAVNRYFTDARADARADERIEAARESSWIALASQWQSAPTLAGTIALGDVYTYTYDDGASGATTRYRLVPSTYSATTDAFYTGFDGTNLTGLVTTRAMEVTP